MQQRLAIIICALLILCLIQLVIYMRITPDLQSKTYIITWWTPFMSGVDKDRMCGPYRCLFTDKRKYYGHSDLGVNLNNTQTY